ncbi:acyl--CoA ligase [Alicyclobacillus tolerans]|uniref:class I adenylate-forming enzyme family protein n=1 Tax=Alicyclobacillus tolerans TaxID=90970 RepID=UPI001F3DE5B8|nr:class I adenylate-forming enzyme family protein [Alicyclobacillus tolerans]MCF8567951.1 acyl--CoA ligase [Alicyclobacillus tolerans]
MYMWKHEILKDVVRENVAETAIRAYRQRPKNLPETLSRSAVLYPDKLAIVQGNVRLSYNQFYERVLAAARYLRGSLNLETGERLAIIEKNTIEFCIMVYAALVAGLIVVPVSTKLKPPEMAVILNNARVRAVFTEIEDLDQKLSGLLETPVYFIKSRHLIADGDKWAVKGVHHDADYESMDFPECDEHDVAFIMYTSGTTGNPKGAMISHFNAIHGAINYEKCYGLFPNDSTVIAVPIFHGTGLMAQLVTFVYLGGTIALLKTFDAQEMLEICQREQITHTICTPTVYNLILNKTNWGDFEVKFRVLGVGGAPLTRELWRGVREWQPNAVFLNTYGLTEATSPALMTPEEMAEHKIGSVGMASPVMDCKIVDMESGRAVGFGEPGEILLKGALITRGYWANREATDKAIVEGWLHTGDVGWMDEDGFVYVCDRIKDMINRGGEKIYSTEVEDVISSHPDVLDVAAVAEPDPVYGEVVKVFVVPVQGKVLEAANIVHWTESRLAKYKVPKYVEFVSMLPRNAGGKVIKRALRH